MFARSILLLVVLLRSVASSFPEPSNLWSRVGRSPRDIAINLHIALRQSRFNELEEHLLQVSDPTHGRYGQHLTASEVHDLVRPSENAVAAVQEWLGSYGIEMRKLSYSPARDWISVMLPIHEAERLLQTEYSVYQHKGGKTVVRAPDWSLPQSLAEFVDDIQPTTSFFRALPRQESTPFANGIFDEPSLVSRDDSTEPDAVSQVCNSSAITPQCLRTLYGTNDYEPQKPPGNRMALTNFHGETNNRSDTKLFLQAHRPDAVDEAYRFKDEAVAGGENSQEPATDRKGREGNLDAQVMLGIGFPTPLVTYTTGDVQPPFDPDTFTPANTNEPFLTWLQYLLAQPDPLPQVISISYGDIEQTVPRAYATRVCRSFAQLGARGVSVIFGAGDSGVGRAGACTANDGSGRREFLSVFPEACPYGTSVGATRGVGPEVVAYNNNNGFVTGGGFSRYFSRPRWQDEAVGAYVKGLEGLHDGLFNRGGRGYPDVAAQGYRFVTVWNATTELVDGTSASAPTFAAVVALVNDALLASGNPPMGFLNPWLYSRGFQAFTDIVDGSNKGCNTSGFPAKPGWDAASGFGTPWFPKVKSLALQNQFREQRPWYVL
ncbi:uncharacterized protein K452DRAFT_320364 [Aplosporella prunicola CBS 121167]|uniref:tripeptidyl-peptidase II n=1 Tax=Aplosporella prunicola CBS 121167 TaxID=1176127 RepID=A0A6A6BBB3_9PEZI|nr:uncharacterized protein K452DRAFT_320364 [Aplosporella prunicola CBS 121167]KAF2139771.1 hypothetical protein K452DRAFT_320364 [Aplosporella prunicola CBS 121167]